MGGGSIGILCSVTSGAVKMRENRRLIAAPETSPGSNPLSSVEVY